MALSAAAQTAIDGLKQELEDSDPKEFEKLSAALVSKLLHDTPVTVAKSGFQAGADGGTSGLRGRRLRIECKRYKDTTGLSSRGLAGEVTQSSQDDPYLEAWVLLATKDVSQTEREQALKAGERFGIAVLVFDWTTPTTSDDLCDLAALCAAYPDDVEREIGVTAATHARALASHVGATVSRLQDDLEVWNIGYRSLRTRSHNRVARIWGNKQDALSALNQDAAGGSDPAHLIKRMSARSGLDAWWASSTPSVCVVKGREGVGKTWVTLDWAVDKAAELPIVLVESSSAFISDAELTEVGLRNFIAAALEFGTELPKPKDYWRARVDRLFKRPTSDGPSFLLVVDGLNQQRALKWANLAQTVQSSGLSGHVRLLVTTRETYFEQDLKRFGKLVTANTVVPVENYSKAELDDILARYGMNSADLHPSLQELAAVPRLFPLVQRLKDSVALQSEASVHRLLYEYGRDVLQQRQGSHLSDDMWAEWLVKEAAQYRSGIAKVGVRQLSSEQVRESVSSFGTKPEDVAHRFGEAVDGGWFEARSGGVTQKYELRPEAVVLALAMALLDEVGAKRPLTYEDAKASADMWLEPIAAFDEIAEVERAALAVLSAMVSAMQRRCRMRCLLPGCAHRIPRLRSSKTWLDLAKRCRGRC